MADPSESPSTPAEKAREVQIVFPKENDSGEHHFVVMRHLIGKSEIYKNEKLGGSTLAFWKS